MLRQKVYWEEENKYKQTTLDLHHTEGKFEYSFIIYLTERII